MRLSLVVVVTRILSLDSVERSLRAIGVRGITVSRVRGWGEYGNTLVPDSKVDEVRIEVFVERDRAEAVARAVIEACHSGLTGDGIVAILPVDKVFSIRTRAEAIPNRPKGAGRPAAGGAP